MLKIHTYTSLKNGRLKNWCIGWSLLRDLAVLALGQPAEQLKQLSPHSCLVRCGQVDQQVRHLSFKSIEHCLQWLLHSTSGYFYQMQPFLDAVVSQEPARSLTNSVNQSLSRYKYRILHYLKTADSSRQQTVKSSQHVSGLYRVINSWEIKVLTPGLVTLHAKVFW